MVSFGVKFGVYISSVKARFSGAVQIFDEIKLDLVVSKAVMPVYHVF